MKARDLAIANPGQQFIVCKALAEVITSRPVQVTELR